MAFLEGKRILLGVSGSIAAYKSVVLLRLLQKAGADTQVVLTPGASRFVAPLTFSTLSQKPVFQNLWDETCDWSKHVQLGNWADAFVIAPATAHTIAKLANGLCEDALCATYLSAHCPVFVAPAMDRDMHRHPSTLRNLETLRGYGNVILSAGTGYLASGLEGQGRMAEPEEVVAALEAHFTPVDELAKLRGKRILITAGPTREPLDPVRYLSNSSTGKMGIALADAATRAGAAVTLILGPTHLRPALPPSELLHVTTAQQMFQATLSRQTHQQVMVMCAAVADFAPAQTSPSKIKKEAEALTLKLVRTMDILKCLGQSKPQGQLLVGFALETDNELANAQAKLHAKNADLIVLNSLRDPGAGFGGDTNKVTLVCRDRPPIRLPLMSKAQLARETWAFIAGHWFVG